MDIVRRLLVVFVCLPIWFYLLYQILVRVNATDVMFLLFWVYFPVAALCETIRNLLRED